MHTAGIAYPEAAGIQQVRDVKLEGLVYVTERCGSLPDCEN